MSCLSLISPQHLFPGDLYWFFFSHLYFQPYKIRANYFKVIINDPITTDQYPKQTKHRPALAALSASKQERLMGEFSPSLNHASVQFRERGRSRKVWYVRLGPFRTRQRIRHDVRIAQGSQCKEIESSLKPVPFFIGFNSENGNYFKILNIEDQSSWNKSCFSSKSHKICMYAPHAIPWQHIQRPETTRALNRQHDRQIPIGLVFLIIFRLWFCL